METHPLLWLAVVTLLAGMAYAFRQLGAVKSQQKHGSPPPSPAFHAMEKSAEAAEPAGHPDPATTNAR